MKQERKLHDRYKRRVIDGFTVLVDTNTGEVVPGSMAQEIPVLETITKNVKEMAQPGSASHVFNPLSPAFTSVPGLTSIRNHQGAVLGMGFFITYKSQKVLCTAYHVWIQATKFSLSLEHQNRVVSPTKWKVVMVSGVEEFDIVMVHLHPDIVSNLGAKTLKCIVPKENQSFSVYGYEKGAFSSSKGQVNFKDMIFGHGLHNASTIPGWSGSPLVAHDGKVIGMHTGAGEKFNTFIEPFWLLINNEETSDYHAQRYVKKFDFDSNDTEAALADRLNYLDDRYDTYESSYMDQQGFYTTTNVGKSYKVRSVIREDPKLTYGYDWNEDTAVFDYDSAVEKYNRKIVNETSFQMESKAASSTSSSLQKKNRQSQKKAVASKELDVSSPLEAIQKESKKPKPVVKRQSNDLVSLISDIPPSTQTQNLDLSLSKPEDTNVFIVRLTRKQEKLYNRICHSRKFQQALKEARNPSILRRRALAFTISCTNHSVGDPLQDFLGMC